jgi:hypothetical protein
MARARTSINKFEINLAREKFRKRAKINKKKNREREKNEENNKNVQEKRKK